MSLTDELAAYFEAHAGEWIDGLRLADVCHSAYAWRSRVSDCRRQFSMTIENRQTKRHDHTFACPAWQAWDVEGACTCGRARVTVKSEYRYVPSTIDADTTTEQTFNTNDWSLR